MDRKKIFGIGAGILLLLTIGTTLAASTENPPTLVTAIETTMGGKNISEKFIDDYDKIPDNKWSISEDEIIIWENKKASELYEIAYITVQKEELDGKSLGANPPTQPLGLWMRWYKVKAKNAWGWTMFTLCARGFFFGMNDEMHFVFPNSYATVEWWSSWAWELDYIEEDSCMDDDWGRVDAEAGFEYFLGGTVELWAYVKCYSDGHAVGNGGQK